MATVTKVKRVTSLLLVAFISAFAVVPFAWAADATSGASAAIKHAPPKEWVETISVVTGIAISPLLGTGAYGAYQWFKAEDAAARAKLPWFAHVAFWLPALLIVGLCAAKDAAGTALPPGLKKPLDVLEVFENKLSGLVAAGAVLPFLIEAFSHLVTDSSSAALDSGLATDGLAMLQLGEIDFTGVLTAVTIPFAILMFAVVWMASHAVNVLILLSPWGAIDAALKAMRTGLLGLLTLSAMVNPWLGAALSLVVIVVAWLLCGWAFRLTVFGSVFCWEFFTNRSARFSPRENDNRMFSGPKLKGVPTRALGRLVMRTEGGLEFYYRRWPWLPEKRALVPDCAALAVGRGLFFSTVLAGEETILLLPPRYCGHEEVLVRAYLMGGGVREAGLRKAWSTLRELFGGAATRTQIV